MKIFNSISFVLLIILASACTSAPKMSAIEYNDKIVNEQNKIIQKILAFSETTSENQKLSEQKRLEAVKQCEASLKIIQEMPDFEGDLQLRDAAIELFLFYRKISEISFKRISEIVQKGEEITSEDLEELVKIESEMEQREIILDEGLANAQKKFSTKHNFNLGENSVQKQIDELDTE